MVAKRQQGFILAAVLWALAIMFVAVGVFHAYVQRKLVIATQAKAHLQGQLDQVSTEQTMLYTLATSRITLAGFTFSRFSMDQAQDENTSVSQPVGDEIWADGTAYVGVGSAQFKLEDNAGFISVNAADQSVLSAFLDRYENDPGEKTRLLGALQDYVDLDDLISLAGAEKMDYQSKGLPEPANDYLRTPPELLRVYGWREWLASHPEIDVTQTFSVGRFSLMNLNTMSKPILMKYLDLQEPLVDQLIKDRRTNPFRSAEDFVLRTGLILNLDEDRYRFLPGNDLRLTIWNKGGGQGKLISLQLTPNGLRGPWLVDYEYSVQSVDDNNEPVAIRQSALFDHPLGDDTRSH